MDILGAILALARKLIAPMYSRVAHFRFARSDYIRGDEWRFDSNNFNSKQVLLRLADDLLQATDRFIRFTKYASILAYSLTVHDFRLSEYAGIA